MSYDLTTVNRLSYDITDEKDLKFPLGFWKKSNCTSCGKEGIYFHGEKKEYHFCIKCNPRIEN